MAIVSPLIMCVSLSVCSVPIFTPYIARDTPKASIESKIITPPMMQSTLSIIDQRPTKVITHIPFYRNNEVPVFHKPEPLPAFTTEIELTPSSWPMRGTFNPLGLKLKLHMPL